MEPTCITHPTRPALSVCHSCGHSFCSDCLVEGEEFYYCRGEACQNALRQDAVKVADERKIQSVKAGFFKRVANFYIDGFIILLLAFPVLKTFGVFHHPITGLILLIIVWLLYYFFFEYYIQKTLAKYLTGTLVRTVDGFRPTGVQILARTLSRLIPLDPYLWRDGRCLHDIISRTRVFNKNLLTEGVEGRLNQGEEDVA
jgi:uncharacterized RDD family membrane protein YckC